MSDEASPTPPNVMLTQPVIGDALRTLGLRAGMTVLVHCSLSKLGWINGGAQAMAGAILDVLGPSGTLMVPTHTPGHTEPSFWQNPPVPAEWWEAIRETRPPFDPSLTPSQYMGALAEFVRTHPQALRSAHPTTSFAAIGPKASVLLDAHDLNDGLGEGSPLARLYDCDGHLLLLGVGHDTNTSLHLSEARCAYAGKTSRREGTAMVVDGRRQWLSFDSEQGHSDDFVALGHQFHRQTKTPIHTLGLGQVIFLRQRPLVDFGVDWLLEHRGSSRENSSC